ETSPIVAAARVPYRDVVEGDDTAGRLTFARVGEEGGKRGGGTASEQRRDTSPQRCGKARPARAAPGLAVEDEGVARVERARGRGHVGATLGDASRVIPHALPCALLLRASHSRQRGRRDELTPCGDEDGLPLLLRE